MAKRLLTLKVNGRTHELAVADHELLIDVLREDAEALGCVAEVEGLREILVRGTSAHRQLRTYEDALRDGGSEQEALASVVDWLVAETSRFARQRPGLFLALAAAGGLLAGRLTRGMTADASQSGPSLPSGRLGNTNPGGYATAVVTTPAERFATEQGRPGGGAVPAAVHREKVDLVDDVVDDDEFGLRGTSVTGGPGPGPR